jgi:hypothetical protein
MNLRLVVGGFMARNTVLSTLLLNYADRLQHECAGYSRAPAPCFIVPTWNLDQRPSSPLASQLLTVEAHTSHDDPRCHENLDAILGLLHSVLTDEHASDSISIRRLGGSPGLMAGRLDTVCKVGIWEVAPAQSQDAGGEQPRLLLWPDCDAVTRTGFCDAVTRTGFLAPGTLSMN